MLNLMKSLIIVSLLITISTKAEGPGLCAPASLKACVKGDACEDRLNRPSRIPNCRGDQLGIIKRSAGTERYFCQYSPRTMRKRPLVVFLHGGGGKADNMYGSTDLRARAEKGQFHLISLQSRNVHLNFAQLKDGRHHDSYYYKWERFSKNHDVADMDLLLKRMVDMGNVDPNRIYFIGWSEGALFSQMYGIMREHVSSPYGHRVKAVVAYTGTNPYHRKYENQRDCESSYKFSTQLPILLMGRSCDAAACSKKSMGTRPDWSDTESMEEWHETLTGVLGNKEVERVIIDDEGREVSRCEVLTCNRWRAVKNHITWPREQEEEMLRFLFGKR